MQPTRILPDLQCSLVCEEVRQEMNGNFIIIGVLNYVHVPQLPVTALRLPHWRPDTVTGSTE